MKFRVLSDSSCDITKEQEEQYHIGIIPYYVSMDGVHYKKDRVEITAEEFYREMAENPGVYPKTSTPTQVDLYNFFMPYAKAGEQVLYFNLTAKFSSSYQSITLIAEELMEEYPACKIIVVDSYSATVQEGLLVTEAARMAEDGLTLEEAAKRIETLKMTSRIFFTTADLSYLQKGGRVGKAMIQVASMLKIKPMIQLYEGELQAAGIVRSRKKSLQRFIDDTKRFFKDKNINDYRICTGYGYDKEEFDALYAEVVEEMRQLGFQGEVEQYHIGCTIGVHTGPTPIGIAVIKKYDA